MSGDSFFEHLEREMKKLIGWQVYTTLLMAAAYTIALRMGMEQVIASILAISAVFLSAMILAMFAVPAVFTVFSCAVIFGLLTEFSMLTSATPDTGYAVATLLVFVVVVFTTFFSLVCAATAAHSRNPAYNDASLQFRWVFSSYSMQGLLVSFIVVA